MINKQFFRDVIDEFFYFYGFGKKWNFEEQQEEKLIAAKKEHLQKKIKQRKRLRWIRRKYVNVR